MLRIFPLFLLLCVKSFSQNIPSQYKLPVVFIGVPVGHGMIEFNGTGFICSVKIDSIRNLLYLVTAKHVVVDERTNKPYDWIIVRINTLTDSSTVFPIKVVLSGPEKDIFFSSDTSVDLAVFSIYLNEHIVKYLSLAEDFAFRSKMDFDTSFVKAGTNVFYNGMFSPYLGYRKNVPITRFGKVCLITDEKVLWDTAKNELADLILVETSTYGGNSGSPVFAYDVPFNFSDTSDHINHLKAPLRLLGIIKGSYLEKTPLGFEQTSSMIPTYTSNVGISAVIPSYLLYEIIYSEELKKRRQLIEEILLKAEKKGK